MKNLEKCYLHANTYIGLYLQVFVCKVVCKYVCACYVCMYYEFMYVFIYLCTYVLRMCVQWICVPASFMYLDILVSGITRNDKGHSTTGHESPEGEQMYSSTLPSTSALNGWSAPRSGRSTPRKEPVSIVEEAGWAPEPVWTGAENLAPTGVRSPDRPARNESLYRLSYPGPYLMQL